MTFKTPENLCTMTFEPKNNQRGQYLIITVDDIGLDSDHDSLLISWRDLKDAPHQQIISDSAAKTFAIVIAGGHPVTFTFKNALNDTQDETKGGRGFILCAKG